MLLKTLKVKEKSRCVSFSSYTKETPWKHGDAIFSEPEVNLANFDGNIFRTTSDMDYFSKIPK